MKDKVHSTFLPRVLAFWLFLGGWLGAHANPGFASSRIEGKKQVLYLRVDFADAPGEVISQTEAERALAAYNRFLLANSGSKASLAGTVTPLLHLPQKAESYAANDWTRDVTAAAETVARAAGFDPAAYDVEIVAAKHPRGAGSRVTAGSKSLVLSNAWGLGATVQGLEQIFGVPEAGLWEAAEDGKISRGYRNPNSIPFDASSGGAVDDEAALLAHHYNTRIKAALGWLAPGAVQNVTANGIYTLWPHDVASPATGQPPVKVLSLAAGYWLEMRRAPVEHPWVTNSLMILRTWDAPESACDLLDLNPRSKEGGWDAGLLTGQTFSDPETGVHVTLLGPQNNPDRLLVAGAMDKAAALGAARVAVNLGRFEGNKPPQLTLRAEKSKVTEGTGLDITAAGIDADGDELTYAWRFGDGTFTGGGSKVTKTWNRSGDYLVDCVATDRKGGTARASIAVTVTSANLLGRWYRIKGTVLLAGQPLAEAYIKVTDGPEVLTNSDGTYTIPGLSRGTYTVNVHKPGYVFSRVGFSNPLTLASNVSGIDFKATAVEANATPMFLADSYAALADPANATAVSVVAAGNDQLYMFATGRDQAVWYRVREGNEWSEWQSLGGPVTSAPAAVSWAPGRIDLFARSGKDVIWHKWLSDGAWSGWEAFPIPGPADSAVAVTSWAEGRLDVFVRGEDNTLRHRWFGGTWSGWESLGGTLEGAPAAISWGEGRIDIVAEGPKGTVGHKAFGDGRWYDWQTVALPEDALPGLALCSREPGQLDMFTRSRGGVLQQQRYAGTWSTWDVLGGPISAPPFGYSLHPGTLEVVAPSGDSLNQLSYDGGWKTWEMAP